MNSLVSPLLPFAHDGKKFYEAVQKRQRELKVSLHYVCQIAGIDFSTTWRWQKGSPPQIKTVQRLEKALKKIERDQATLTHNQSKMDMPSARQ